MTPSRLIICTPVDGAPQSATVSHGYHVAVRQLERSGAVLLPAELCFADDLSRARSRCVRVALQRPDWDWLLHWDDDVVPKDTQIVPRMVSIAEENGYHVLGAPYPRKRIPAAFPYKPLQTVLTGDGHQRVENNCIEVSLLAFGFVLTSRACLEKMVQAYAHEWFSDSHDPKHLHETVALFRQVMTEETSLPDGKRYRELYGEDYSFCHRWRGIGGKVHMFVGEGSPLMHVGGHVFTGAHSELGNVR